ncbi:MAG: Fe2+ transport system protein [Chthonomonadaceae bacterium]|nr:Fe2+ transport system protein [Chthonomonadaceae bacterium]
MHPSDNRPHCKTRNLLDWLRRQKQQNQFAQSAQDALDTAESVPASGGGRGTLYRAGLTLAELKPGECGTIRRLLGASQGRLRLLEMGLTPGVHIRVIRAAAFGGPLDILVRGYQLSLRRDEAASVWLDDEEPSK